MEDVVAVKVVNGIKGLGEDTEGLGLCEGVIVWLEGKQVSLFSILHDQINLIDVLNHIPQPDNMGMTQPIVYTDLPLQQAQLILPKLAVHTNLPYQINYYLYGIHLSRTFMCPQPDSPKWSYTQWLSIFLDAELLYWRKNALGKRFRNHSIR